MAVESTSFRESSVPGYDRGIESSKGIPRRRTERPSLRAVADDLALMVSFFELRNDPARAEAQYYAKDIENIITGSLREGKGEFSLSEAARAFELKKNIIRFYSFENKWSDIQRQRIERTKMLLNHPIVSPLLPLSVAEVLVLATVMAHEDLTPEQVIKNSFHDRGVDFTKPGLRGGRVAAQFILGRPLRDMAPQAE